jgi:dolichol-phosphate mannosyltransferase
MIAFALSGITSFSHRPLRLAFLLGVLVTLLAAAYAVFILYAYVVGMPLQPGWTSMLLVTLTLSGVQLITLGIASEYLARLYFEVKGRPVYILRARARTSGPIPADDNRKGAR